jgi:hypothetical protein
MNSEPSTPHSLVAYLDLLGTAYSARTSEKEYGDKLQSLKEGITQNCNYLDPSATVVLLHSSAFVCSRDSLKLVSFLKHLRSSLLAKEVFLQAAVSQGDIGDQIELTTTTPGTALTEEQRRAIALRKKMLKGFTLDSQTASVFSDHYRFTGIGIKVNDVVRGQLSDADSLKTVCASSYFVNSRSRAAERFSDILFDQSDLRTDRFDLICFEYVRLRSRFRAVSSHFIPLFITLIRSVDWSKLPDVDLPRDPKEEDVSIALSLFSKIVGPWYTKHFSDVPFREYIVYALVDAIFAACGSTCNRFKTVAHRGASEQFLRKLEEVPECILTGEARVVKYH